MATTNISTEIVSITGVSAHGASDDFIVSAQKFVVASVPKELLPFAVNRSSSSNDGSAIPIENDSIVDVQRNEYSCKQISLSESKWANDTTSLKKSTAISPVYWIKNDGVQIAPDTDGSNLGYVFYVNYAEVDDDSDLRDAVVYRACSSEYSKLSSAELPTVSIAAVPPDVPNLTTVTFSSTDSDLDATAPTFTTATVTAAGTYGTANGFNAYYPLSDFPDTDPGVLTISVSAPTTPSDPSISSPGITTTPKGDISDDVPSYTKPSRTPQVPFNSYWTLGDFGDSDPGELSVTSVFPSTPSLTSVVFTSVDIVLDAAAPVYSTATISAASTYTGSAPTFTKPSVAPNFAQVNTHLDTNEDVELAQVKIQEIGAQISEYSADIQNEQAEFNKENVLYQSAIQESMQEVQIANQVNLAQAQSDLQTAISNKDRDQQRQLQNGVNDMQAIINDNNRKISLYQSEVQTYQADVSKQVQEYTQKLSRYQLELGTVYQAWAKTESDSVSSYQADIQNELNEFNKENARYQANVQAEMQKQQHLAAEYQKEGDLTFQASIQDYSQEIALFSGEIQKYQAQVNDEVQEYSQKLARYQLELNTVYQAWTQELQAALQESMQEIQVENQVNIAQGQASLQVAIDNEQRSQQRQLQNGVNDMQAIVTSNQDLISKYQSELQQYSGEVQAELSEYQSKISKQQAYSKEADKYYQWSVNCINMYIQNNSKMIAATMASRSQAAQA